jgi:hypothetical protein
MAAIALLRRQLEPLDLYIIGGKGTQLQVFESKTVSSKQRGRGEQANGLGDW